MRLYIVRHAWAEEPDSAQWPDDSQRPLTDDGMKRFRDCVRALSERGFAPRLIAASPYVRTRQTAEIMQKHLPKRAEIELLPCLQCGGRWSEAVDWTANKAEQEVAWVAHMPEVSLMVAALVGDGGAAIDFSKGACAAIDFDGAPALAAGTLRWFATAKILGC